MSKNKSCPIFLLGFLMFRGHSTDQDISEIACWENCSWYDSENNCCIIYSALKAIKDKTNG